MAKKMKKYIIRRIPRDMTYKIVYVFNPKTKRYKKYVVPNFFKARNAVRKKWAIEHQKTE